MHRRTTLEVLDSFFDVFSGVHSFNMHQAKEEVGTIDFLFGCFGEVPVGGLHHIFLLFLLLLRASLDTNGLVDFLTGRVNGLTGSSLGHLPDLGINLLKSDHVVRVNTALIVCVSMILDHLPLAE